MEIIKDAARGSEVEETDANVRKTVEGILADIAQRGDDAVRELSEKFDKWSPQSFRLSDADIEAALSKVAKSDIEDIKFAQAQVRNFAQKQRDTMLELEVETLPGVTLGHKHVPIACTPPSTKISSAPAICMAATMAG